MFVIKRFLYLLASRSIIFLLNFFMGNASLLCCKPQGQGSSWHAVRGNRCCWKSLGLRETMSSPAPPSLKGACALRPLPPPNEPRCVCKYGPIAAANWNQSRGGPTVLHEWKTQALWLQACVYAPRKNLLRDPDRSRWLR